MLLLSLVVLAVVNGAEYRRFGEFCVRRLPESTVKLRIKRDLPVS